MWGRGIQPIHTPSQDCSLSQGPNFDCLWSINQCLLIQLAAAAAKSFQSCLTRCNPIDSSPPGSPVPGILQARTLEWVAISFSNAWKWKVKVKFLSRVRLLVTPWTAAHQAPPSMGFSRQEYLSGVPLPVYTKRWPRFWTIKINGIQFDFQGTQTPCVNNLLHSQISYHMREPLYLTVISQPTVCHSWLF